MSSVINGEMINSLLTLPESEAYQKLSELNARLATVSNFQSVDTNTRKNIVKMIELGVNEKPSMIAPALELIRILARDKRQLDLLLTESVRLFIVCASSLCENGLKVVQDVIEADKCLINTLANSSCMRETFEMKATSFLLERLTVFTKADYSGKYDWIKNVPEESRNAIWLFDLRIAFLISAYSNNIQLLWGSSSSAISLFINIIHQYIAAVNEVNESKSEKIDVHISNACDRAAEAAKVLFNITYKRTAVLDQCFTNEITEIVVALIKGPNISPVMEQHAVNLLATLNLNMDLLCPKMDIESTHAEQYDHYDMCFAQALLNAIERKLDETQEDQLDGLAFLKKALERVCAVQRIPRAKRIHCTNLARDRDKWKFYWCPLGFVDDQRESR